MTEKQLKFCEHYIQNGGNLTKAALSAGYSAKTAYSIGSENMKKPEIIEYLSKHGEIEGMIADSNEILKFWTEIMNSDERLLSDRLKASENLAKAKGMFSERFVFENSRDNGFDINIHVVK